MGDIEVKLDRKTYFTGDTVNGIRISLLLEVLSSKTLYSLLMGRNSQKYGNNQVIHLARLAVYQVLLKKCIF